MRQHGAMDSTLVSEARDPSSNPGGIQSREKVFIGVEEKAMNEESRVMIIAVFLCKNGFWLFLAKLASFLVRTYLGIPLIFFLFSVYQGIGEFPHCSHIISFWELPGSCPTNFAFSFHYIPDSDPSPPSVHMRETSRIRDN